MGWKLPPLARTYASHFIKKKKKSFTAHRGSGSGSVTTLHPDYFLSYRLHCEDYLCAFYPSIWPTNNNRTASGMVNEEATIFCLLFCHKEHSLNKTQDCELLHCLTKKCTGFLIIGRLHVTHR